MLSHHLSEKKKTENLQKQIMREIHSFTHSNKKTSQTFVWGHDTQITTIITTLTIIVNNPY